MKEIMLIAFGLLVIIVVIIAAVWVYIVVRDLSQIPIMEDPQPLALTTKNFAVFPKTQMLFKNQNLIILAGIKNDAPDFEAHEFVINIIPEVPETAEWIDFYTTPRTVYYNAKHMWGINMEPDENATYGTYLFHIVACRDPIVSMEACDLETTNWGEPHKLVVTLQV